MISAFKIGAVAAAISKGAATDPHYASVKLLLHMNGANNSTTFTDNSPTPKTASVFSDARISTAQSKFGTASGLFGGGGSSAYISYPDSEDWNPGAGNYTCEFWARPDLGAPGARLSICGQGSAGGGETPFFMAQTAAGKWQCAIYNGIAFQSIVSSADSLSGVWHHLAFVKQGTTVYFYVNGVSQGTFTIGNAGQLFNSATVFSIGRFGAFNAEYFDGYLDEFRVTKGVARYPNGTTFTPPAEQFPDS